MTKFRLAAGRPATFHRGGSPARPKPEEAVEVNHRVWTPNQEPDTPLRCGCKIPWPITVLLGSGGKVMCDQHGWQPRLSKAEIQRSERAMRQWVSTAATQAIPDLPPF